MNERISSIMRPFALTAVFVLLAALGGAVHAQTFCVPPSPPPTPPPPNKPDPNCDKCSPNCKKSPCFTATGVYTTSATDLRVKTIHRPLVVNRRYQSDRLVDGPLGLGWNFGPATRLFQVAYLYSAPSTYQYRIEILLPEGDEIEFTQNSDGTYTAPQGIVHSLVKNADGTWTFTYSRTRSTVRFAADGSVTALVDDYGNTINFTYDANGRVQRMADAAGSGRYVDITWGPDGRISMASDSTSRQVKYFYDTASGALTSVSDAITSSDPTQRSTYYTYTAGRFGPVLSRIEDKWHRLVSALDWYPSGQLKTYTDGDYNENNPAASTGERYTYNYAPNPPTGPPYTAKSDSLGAHLYQYESQHGLVNDHVTWDPYWGLPARTWEDDSGAATDFAYNARGNVQTMVINSNNAGFYGSVAWTYAYDSTYPDLVTSMTSNLPNLWPGYHFTYYQPGSAAPGALQNARRLRTDGTTEDFIAEYQYNGKGQKTYQNVANEGARTYMYNAAGDLTQVSSSAAGITTYEYDALGRMTKITDASNRVTTYAYDALDRVTSVTLPKPTSTSPAFVATIAYDVWDAATGLTFTNVTDPNNKVKRSGYDALGNLVKVIDQLGNTTTIDYQYNLPKKVRDANGNETTFTYSSLRQISAITYPDGQTEHYSRTEDGRITSFTDRNGITVLYSYDPWKRLRLMQYQNQWWPNGAFKGIAYGYNGAMLTGVGDQMQPTTPNYQFTYDSSFRLLTEGPIGGYLVTYAYPAGSTETLFSGYTVSPPFGTNEPSQTVTIQRNALYYLPTSIQWNHIPYTEFSISWNPDGMPAQITFPNGQTRTYTYDGQGRMTSVRNEHPQTGIIAQYDYGYDYDWSTNTYSRLGQRTSVQVSGSQAIGYRFTKYYYDDAYRLTRADSGNNSYEAWQYDAIGNRTRRTVSGSNLDYNYYHYANNPNNSNRIQGWNGATLYTYDSNGNQTTYGSYSTYTWDFLNRLTNINGASITHTYDYQNRRVSTQYTGGANNTSKYIYRGDDMVAERNSAYNRVDDFLFLDRDLPLAKWSSNGSVSYFSVDGLGSITAANDPSGNVAYGVTYSAFGDATSWENFGFTGRENAQPALFYRARWYDPVIGRFLSEDPLKMPASNPYVYVDNDPVNRVDPTGMQAMPLPFFGPYPGDPSSECLGTIMKWAWKVVNKSEANVYDKYLHCMAGCEIGHDCGDMVAVFMAVAKEKLDGTKKPFSGGKTFGDPDINDALVTIIGDLGCKSDPRGCDCCCKSKGYGPNGPTQ